MRWGRDIGRESAVGQVFCLGMAILLLSFLGAEDAQARPLKLSEIAAMGEYVVCTKKCSDLKGAGSYEEHVAYQECTSGCGYAPRLWEKNGVYPIDESDQKLALLEYQDAQPGNQTPLICYADEEETIVVPGALCSGSVCEQAYDCTEEDCAKPLDGELDCKDQGPAGPICLWPPEIRPAACPDVVCVANPAHTYQECSDEDGDGLPLWLEEHLGSEPMVADELCNLDAPCSFQEVCQYSEDVAAGFCVPRNCPGACTAFHLALVAQDDQEVIIHVFYDFTPIPARALDLYIEYDQADLTLQDSRRLAPLILHSKEMATTHLADGTLRLSVFDTGGTHPIPTGPIVELVFQRHTTEATLVAFSKKDDLQLKSIAPLQGSNAIQQLLSDDALWGTGVLVPALDKVTTKLKLWYGFNSTISPLNYSNVATAAEMCALHAPCANEVDSVEQAKWLARLEALQAGTHYGGEAIEGLSGSAIYLDGTSDHLRMPIHFREPLAPISQSFSMSTWFYSEGNSASELKKTPQIIYQHMSYDERTRFGLALKPAGGDMLKLYLFSGDMLSKAPPPEEVLIADNIPERTWHHAGFALDASTGKTDLYLDGERVAEYTFAQPPAAVSCPQFFGATNVVLHEEGDVLGGRPPQFVYLAREENNLYKIHRMDPSGLSDVELLADNEFSFKDPDYSPVVDKIVYASNASGNFEIWMADGDGTNRKQLTVGFGDASLGITARRPRWAPDASAIVFDSNAFSAILADNDFARVKHLYYIGYDPVNGQLNIEGPGGVVFDQLDYGALVAAQIVENYRLTSGSMGLHHSDARWLTGRDLETGALGELLMSAADPGYDATRVYRLEIDAQIPLSKAGVISGLGAAQQDVRLLAAVHSEKPAVPQPIVTERLFYELSYYIYNELDDQFSLLKDEQNEKVSVTVSHVPSGYQSGCWDTNFNMLDDAAEDLDENGVWNLLDCYPYEIRNLYVKFDPAVYVPVLEDESGQAQEIGNEASGKNKKLELQAVYPAQGAFVRIEILSPLNTTPLGSGKLVKLHFVKKLGLESDMEFSVWQRDGIEQYVVKDLSSSTLTTCVDGLKNGAESDVDCGGECNGCSMGQVCTIGDDCDSTVCVAGACAPETCADNVYTEGEADTDCGGDVCAPCGAGEACQEAGDCLHGVCVDNICLAPQCGDQLKNGTETDVDCGGSCGPCQQGMVCQSPLDCESGVCKTFVCAPSSCGNGVVDVDAAETDVDCGGECMQCMTGQLCQAGPDCDSGVCEQEPGGGEWRCVAPACSDGLKNGPETDLDCGGGCGLCGEGAACKTDADCTGSLCVGGQCSGGAMALAGLFDTVDDSIFSPDGGRLLLSAFSHSRPVLLRTQELGTAAGAEKILLDPRRLRGLDWVRRDQFMACNWVGGYQHPQSKTIWWGLRGGLDDMKVYTGLRDPDAFRSEAERGHDYLKAAGLDGELETKLPSCTNSHLECPSYYLCVEGECIMVACDPEDPYSCSEHGGRCTLRPLAVEQEFAGPMGEDLFAWVCAADCTVDAHCYVQECLNGPCQFCDPATLTCIECRNSVKTIGDVTVQGVEGCPDQKSFRCEAGTCITDCYAFVDDKSIYLCDQSFEYCDQGQCVVHDWTWWDLAPASFQGGFEMRRLVPPDDWVSWFGYTMAVDQRIPIVIRAYGVTDYGVSPEIVVEAKHGPFFGEQWHRIGEAVVMARSETEALLQPIVLTSNYPFSSLRLRLVTSPYDNVSGGATGLMEDDKDFCLADVDATAAASGEAPDYAPCYRRAQGSRYTLGYRADIPWHEAVAACKEQGGSGCPAMKDGIEHNHLYGGNPAVRIVGLEVAGGSVMSANPLNKICPYGEAGSTIPWAADGITPQKVLYGDITTEDSPQKDALCAQSPEACVPPGANSLAVLQSASPVLNCNVFDPAHGDELAALTLTNFPVVRPWPASSGAVIQDNGDQCMVELNEMLTTACYEWRDGKASFDPYSAIVTVGEAVEHGGCDWATFRSFGHDEGFQVTALQKYNVQLVLDGYESSGLKVKCDDAIVTVPGGSTAFTCPAQVKDGRGFTVKIHTQPDSGLLCIVLGGQSLFKVQGGDATVQILCGELFTVGGHVAGMNGGTLKLLGSMKKDGASVSAKEVLALGDNGNFTFNSALPVNGTYNVSVQSHPEGQFCSITGGVGPILVSADVTNVSVDCVDAPPHSLSVKVNGLLGAGMEVLEKKTGAVIKPDATGTHTVPGEWHLNDEYDFVISKYPTDPQQNCTLDSGGSGAMPNKNHVGVTISCLSVPTFKVSGQVIGLTDGTLQLVLNDDETKDIVTPEDSGSMNALPFVFATGLVDGQDFNVQVAKQPASASPIACEVTMGQGKISGANYSQVIVMCAPVIVSNAYYVGGTVTGLEGTGLKLQLKGGGYEVEINDNGAWIFPNVIGNKTNYTVVVSRNPTNPVQSCKVDANGTGTVESADVGNVTVTCQSAVKVLLELDVTGSAGVPVKVQMFSANQLVAVQPKNVQLNNGGKAVFYLVEPGGSGGETQMDAALTGGQYVVLVYVNCAGDKLNGMDSNFELGESSAAFKVLLTATGNHYVYSLEGGDFGPLRPGAVLLKDLDDIAKGTLACHWLPEIVPDTDLEFPLGAQSPSVAVSKSDCTATEDEDDDKGCHDGDGAHTQTNGIVPISGADSTFGTLKWDVHCWIDSNGNKVPDKGDYRGKVLGVAAPTSAESPVEVDVEVIE